MDAELTRALRLLERAGLSPLDALSDHDLAVELCRRRALVSDGKRGVLLPDVTDERLLRLAWGTSKAPEARFFRPSSLTQFDELSNTFRGVTLHEVILAECKRRRLDPVTGEKVTDWRNPRASKLEP